ncbi:MAG: RNA polymerase sigma factor [Kineosporiaceae bacterium]|jgi:RNA polymerase sigma factor (sigma-70 family)
MTARTVQGQPSAGPDEERLTVSRTASLSRLCDAAAADFVAWRAGEAAALDRLVRALSPMLWHTVRAYRLDAASAEDVVQTTWLAFVRAADRVEEPQAVVRWLAVTARREAWRTARSAGRVDLVEDEVIDVRTPPGESTETAVVRNHRDEALWAAVGRLPERCRRLLRVVAFSDRPDYGVLSQELGMPMGSIGPTRGRCLDKLRALLGAPQDWRTA